MDYLQNIGNGVVSNGQLVLNKVLEYLPQFLTAVVVALIGFVVAKFLKKVTVKIAKKMKVDSLIKKTNLDEQLKDAEIKTKISTLLGEFVKWIVLIITLLFVTGMFESLSVVTDFIKEILSVIGNVIVALFIFAVAVYAARFAGAIAKAVANYIDLKNTSVVENVVKAIIYFIAVIQILNVLHVNGVLEIVYGFLQAAFYGTALALGLAFGLGGQDKAKEILEKLKK